MDAHETRFSRSPSATTERLVLRSPQETERLGQALGQVLEDGLVIGLLGPLGAGKTTLVRGLARGMGLSDRVTSPTFTLVNEYGGREPEQPRLIHVDVYRLDPHGAEAETIGLADLLDQVEAPGATRPIALVVEWAERVADWLPEDRLEIRLDYSQALQGPSQVQAREAELRASGPHSQAVLCRARPRLEQLR